MACATRKPVSLPGSDLHDISSMPPRPILLPMVIVTAICIVASTFLYPQAREDVRRYVQWSRGRDTVTRSCSSTTDETDRSSGISTAKNATDSISRSAEDADAGMPTSGAAGRDSVPSNPPRTAPQTHDATDDTDGSHAAAKQDGPDIAERRDPHGQGRKGTALPTASLQAASPDTGAAGDALSIATGADQEERSEGRSSKRVISPQMAADIAEIPAKEANQAEEDKDRHGVAPTPAIPFPGPGAASETTTDTAVESSGRSGVADQAGTSTEPNNGTRTDTQRESGGATVNEEGPAALPPLVPVPWPPRGGREAETSRSEAYQTKDSASRSNKPAVEARTRVPKVRRLPPPEPETRPPNLGKSAVETVEPIPLYPDTGYPAFLP